MATSRRPTLLQRSLRKLGIQSKPIDIEFAESRASANREILLEEELATVNQLVDSFPALSDAFKNSCTQLCDYLLPLGTTLSDDQYVVAEEKAATVNESLSSIKEYAAKLDFQLRLCSKVDTDRIMKDSAVSLGQTCENVDSKLHEIIRCLKRRSTPSEQHMNEFDKEYRSITKTQAGLSHVNKTNHMAENKILPSQVTEEMKKECKRVVEMLNAFRYLFGNFYLYSFFLVDQLRYFHFDFAGSLKEAEYVTDSLLALNKLATELNMHISCCTLMNTDVLKMRVQKHLEGCARVEDLLTDIKSRLQDRRDTANLIDAFWRACEDLSGLRKEILGESAA